MVTTLDELAAMPAGERVVVQSRNLGDRTWERVDDGLQPVDPPRITLPLDQFEGAVASNMVRRADPPVPEVGQLYYAVQYRDRRYHYLVVEVDAEQEQTTCLFFRTNHYRETRRRGFADLRNRDVYRLADELPEWYPLAHELGVRMARAEAANHARDTELVAVRDQARALRERVEGLHQWMEDHPPATGKMTGTLQGTVTGTVTVQTV